jgi:maltooligosyltrehalose synthase
VRLPREAPHSWQNVFTGEAIQTPGNKGSLNVDQLFGHFPVALLSGEKSPAAVRKRRK